MEYFASRVLHVCTSFGVGYSYPSIRIKYLICISPLILVHADDLCFNVCDSRMVYETKYVHNQTLQQKRTSAQKLEKHENVHVISSVQTHSQTMKECCCVF